MHVSNTRVWEDLSIFVFNFRLISMDELWLWRPLFRGRPWCPIPAGKCSRMVTSLTRCTPQVTSTGAYMSVAVAIWCTVTVGRDFTNLLSQRNEELCVWCIISAWILRGTNSFVHCVDVSATQSYQSCQLCSTHKERGGGIFDLCIT